MVTLFLCDYQKNAACEKTNCLHAHPDGQCYLTFDECHAARHQDGTPIIVFQCPDGDGERTES